MKHLITAVLFCWLPLVASANSTPQTWDFRVLLDGREIGHHRFALSEIDGGRELLSEARFDVRVLFVNAYRYRHQARERWYGDCLRSIDARTESNGELARVRGGVRGERLIVEREGTSDAHDGCIMTFAYWNPEILTARQLLNTQTGELLPVTVKMRGTEAIVVRGRKVLAERHRLDAPGLGIDLWYLGGEWLALESELNGGRRLRYERR